MNQPKLDKKGITQLANGQWKAQITERVDGGKSISKQVGVFKTQAEAQHCYDLNARRLGGELETLADYNARITELNAKEKARRKVGLDTCL